MKPSVAEELSLGTLVLGDGVRMPRLGVGTAGPRITAAAVHEALRAGIRLLDTAVVYANERRLAAALARSGIGRSRLFIVSKAWPFDATAGNDRSEGAPTVTAEQLTAAVDAHVTALAVGYLDLLLLHWPSRALVAHWEALVALRRAGRARAIGLSNANERHLEVLRRAGAHVLPSLVQTELAPVRADARNRVVVEPLVRYCAQHGVALMAHSPVRTALRDARAQHLAAARNVTVPQLVLRYGLQRGFAMIFSTRSAAHLRSNLRVFDFEVSAAEMGEMACWRGEAGCRNLTAAVGAQAGALRHHLPQSAWLSPPPRNPTMLVAPGEADPITLGAGRSAAARCAAELRAAPQLAVAAPGVSRPMGSVTALRRGPRADGAGCGGKRCDFRLRVARPANRRYRALVRALGGQLNATLADPRDSWRMFDRLNGRSGAQHVLSVRDGRGWRYDDTLRELVEEHIKPLLAQHAYASARLVLKKATASRNANDFPPERHGRSRSMLWHYDGLADGLVKVILYLTDVDDQHGCMVVMKHNRTGAPFAVDPRAATRLFGRLRNTLPVVPALWLSELAAQGYEPTCLAGPAGSLVIFDVNIVHRGSRPAAGMHRDFVLLEFCSPGREAKRARSTTRKFEHAARGARGWRR